MLSFQEKLEAIYILKVADFGMATIKPFDGTFYFEQCNGGTLSNAQVVETKKLLSP